MALTSRAVSRRLGVSLSTVRWYIRKGKLKATKFNQQWLITEEEYETFRAAREAQFPPKETAA